MTVVFLVPALGTTESVWDDVRGSLPANVRTVDLPLHGADSTADGADGAGGASSLERLADRVVAAADERGVERFHYAGVSLGGLIGLEVALRHPHRLKSATVISASVEIDRALWRERAQRVRTDGLGWLAASSERRWFSPGFSRADPSTVTGMLGTLGDLDIERYAALCDAMATTRLHERIGEIRVPTLVVSGEHDQAAPWAQGRALAESIPGARFQVIREAAHMVPVERPAPLTEVMTSFFAELVAA